MITIIRKFKDTGELIALFPCEFTSLTRTNGLCMLSYMMIGQHGSAFYPGMLETTIPVNYDSQEVQDFVKHYETSYGEKLSLRTRNVYYDNLLSNYYRTMRHEQ